MFSIPRTRVNVNLPKKIGGEIMRAFQIVLTIIVLLAVLSMFGFNLWIAANFSKSLELPKCYTPLNYITTALIAAAAITVFIRR